MAVTRKVRTVVNPSRGKRRKLTPKQIRFFGTKAQRAALRRSRSRKPAASTSHTKKHRRAPRRSSMQNNPGEIVSILLNPPQSKEFTQMAKTKKRAAPKSRRHNAAHATAKRRTHHRMATKANPAGRRRRTVRHNPAPRVGGLITNALWIIAGAVGSKLLTQAVLGAKNSGAFGYGGNALATALLGFGTTKMLKNESAGNAVIAGGVVQIVLRALTDFTPFGKYTSQLGLGDYLASNFVVPQRYVDPLNSAMVELPPGWAPRLPAPAPAAASAGMSGAGLYGGAALY